MINLELGLLLLTLYIWHKDKNFLEKVLNNCLWIIGILYGKFVSSELYTKIKNYLNNNQIKNNSNNKKIFTLEDSCYKILDIEKINQSNAEKFYVSINLQPENTEKILVFDNKENLVSKFNDLETLTRLDKEKFNNILEVINNDNGVEITNILMKYISNEGFFENITNYNLKVSDLYDFEKNSFITKSKITITNMNLDSKEFNLSDVIKL